MNPPDRISRYILILIVLVTGIMGIWIFLYPPALFPDPSWGFQALRGTKMGAGFNTLINPNNDDISKTSAKFLSWWSPGQYFVPYSFTSVFNINLGRATALTISLCSLSGLAGLYLFFKKTGFTPIISALSVAFIACQVAYVIPYLFYNGGEIVLFAFTGWFLYGCIYFEKGGASLIIFLFISGLIGFFCKSSFLWMYVAGCLYMWISLSAGKKITGWLTTGVTIAIPVIASLTVIYITYLSKGDNPAANNMGLKLTWDTFSFPAAAPLLAGFSIDDIALGIINHSVFILVVLALVSAVLVIYISQNTPFASYGLMLIVFYLICILFFGASFLRQANISYEARHMRVIGLLVTPGVIYAVRQLKLSYRLIFGLIWLFISLKSIAYVYNIHQLNKDVAYGDTGLGQIYIDQPTLNYLRALDKAERKSVFAFISPDLGLEISHNQIITFDRLSNDLRSENDIPTFNGHAGPVHIILPKSYMGAKATVYLKSFPDYHHVSVKQLSNYYVVYTAE